VRAVIVGGGIGGLAAGGALERVGWDAVVVERARALETVGAGIALSSNALRGLDQIGVGQSLRKRGHSAERLQARTPDGDVLMDVPLRERGWEMLGVHRADLQSALLDAVGADAVRLGVACTGFRREGEQVVAELADGTEEPGAVLVGADGIRSLVRKRVLADGPPSFAGYVGWRAVADFEDERVQGRMSETWGRGLRFGLIPISHGRLYWFVSQTAPEPDAPLVPGDRAALAAAVAGWHEPIEAAVAATPDDAISGTGIYWRKPVKRWGEGTVTLLGDAAHPMTPDMGQGAAQAIEDAVVLAASLRDAATAEQGLRAYEAARMPRTAAVVRRSRQLGRLAQARNPVATWLRTILIGRMPAAVQQRQQATVIEYELPELASAEREA
jgi:2-polyprenyl-6-methoxyphenol hydroxylase-like FAD-dependent oxidoreductase